MTDGLALARSVVGLVVVLGLLGLFAWLVRRGTLTLPGQRRGSSAIRVETAVPLGERRSLVVVAVEGRRLLVGLTPAQVSLVTELAPAAAGFETALNRSVAAMKDPS